MLYIALLRGINVGGHRVKMERLGELFAELGFANVRTYIQSGNVFFEAAEGDREALTQAIEGHLRQALGYDTPTFLRTAPELERTLALDPFKGATVSDDMRLNVVFAARPIPQTLALPVWSAKRDTEIRSITALDAFIAWYLKDGKAPTSQGFLEKTLGSPVTTRFIHTTAKILEAARAS